ncbi:acyl-CoA thioesterase [Pararhodobacter zhoushanensis]|uniref:acyl-CoA thioesterase n=1 Tax=Pararhodobacter zhoushanensis TaxID=2479545 RepID=UPI000F8F2DE6|nr:acyl-CoA thioesterase [Pararhodobacter zhoushanensis]
MYPVIRLLKETLKFRGKSLSPFDTHLSHHRCWPWDLDPWRELNNGRTLTLYDLGRVPFSARIGMTAALMKQRWGMTVAGSSVRYRRRVRMFQRFEMRTRSLGWDGRFFYIEQSMWRQGEALNHVLIRAAVTSHSGIVSPAALVAAMGYPDLVSPALPEWVQAWIAADAQRPWPPMGDGKSAGLV